MEFLLYIIILAIVFLPAILFILIKYLKKRFSKRNKTIKNIINAVNNGENLFITGGAGTGKSYILNLLREKFEMAVTSTTGISAISIKGQTIHSWAGIGIANQPINTVVNKIFNNKHLRDQIIDCKILAIDEVSMLHADVIEYVDEVLKQVRRSDKPFGGIQVLLFGDFYQLAPVNKQKNAKVFCFESQTWEDLNLKTFVLDEVYRQDNKKFIESLNNLRVGNLGLEDVQFFNAKNTSEDFNKDIVHLYPTNAEVNKHNDLKLSQMNSNTEVFKSTDVIHQGDTQKKFVQPDDYKFLNDKDAKVLAELNKYCKVPRELKLKQFCQVMLRKNIDFGKGLINGSVGIFLGVDNDKLKVMFENNQQYLIEPELFEYHKEGQLVATRNQFPISLAYAITINKSQGMTLKEVHIDLNKIFAEGQAYVAISRVKCPDGLFLRGFNPTKIKIDERVKIFYNYLNNTLIS